MRNSVFVLFLGILVSLTSCRKDFDTTPSNGNLAFSKTTVYLDTVFSNISSSTYMLKVYNQSNKDINIPSIKLAKPDSKYRLMVDGMTGEGGNGRYFPNVELLAKDSLFIFIETTVNIADANPTDFLYTDEIEFASTSGVQKVNLVTLIQDAVFLYPAKDDQGVKEKLLLGLDENGDEVYVNGFELDSADPIHGDEFHFTKDKPYVIYGFAGIPAGKELVIDPGARVHFHAQSGIVVKPGGSIKVGEGWTPPTDPDLNPLENEVVFEGDRLEPGFAETPGQWFAVWMLDGSAANLNHLVLKNATVGMLIEKATATITNSQFYNCANVGILGREATMVTGSNLVVNYAGQACVASISGGNYDFRHCTFNNNWGSPDQVAVSMSNYEEDANGNKTSFPLTSLFKNSIIYGSNNIEVYLNNIETSEVLVNTFDHCLIKFKDVGTVLANDPKYNLIRQQIRNQDPKFQFFNLNPLLILEGSPAIGTGVYDPTVPKDILDRDRPNPNPDIGAYQYISD
ncbi:MAG TPA: right-handed parallel beta-helix repeat-containing protein [Flavobacterium sp.]|nr:right-handed parallel beta-helix repeat-containing protein [Flavobacterium sp.]HPJ09382.1 right-handed parallel beta-helix repeat-containing protein [Flavobacterium sp.]